MLSRSVAKYLTNPIIGILPFVVYTVLQTYLLPIHFALIVAIVLTLVGEFILRRYFDSRIYGLTFYFTLIALGVITLLWAIGNRWIENMYTYILTGEIVIIIQLMVFRFAKTILKARLFKERTFMEKVLLDDCFFIAAVLKYLLTVHVFVLLAYKQLAEGRYFPTIDHYMYAVVPSVIIVGLFIYQNYKTKFLINKLRAEEWLPIVTEKGEVTGKIARAVSRTLKNKHMHPVVRIALICNKKLYIQERGDDNMLDIGKLDHPFEKYMLFEHEVNTAAHNSIKRTLGTDIESEPRFVVQYVFENEVTKRLIFLFTVEIEDECLITRTGKMTGKFWTVKQIDQEFEDGIFGECFELEYEYLKHMILLEDADDLIKKEGAASF